MSDWLDGWDGWLSYTAVTPRASLKSDANKNDFFCPCLSVTMTFCRIDINLENNSTSFLGGVMWNTQEIELGKVEWTES